MTAQEIEIVGPASHDGMRLQVPDQVVALIVVTNRDGEYEAVFSRRRKGDIDDERIANALHSLLINAGWPL